MHAVSNLVDPFWHMHILHTKEYMKFCDQAVGGYMHHKPHDPNNETDINFLDHVYHETVKIYDQLFDHVDPEFNPRKLLRVDLICWHGNEDYEASDHAILAKREDLQAIWG